MPSNIPWPLYCIPAIRVAGRFPFSPQISRQTFCHPTFALHQHHYPGIIVIGKKRFELKPGDLTLTPPDTKSRYSVRETSHHWCIHFTPYHVHPSKLSIRTPLHLSLGARADLISERFRTIAEIFARGSSGSSKERECARAEAGAMLQSLLLKIPTIVPEPSRRHYKRKSDGAIEAVRQKLDLKFQDPLSVDELSRESGLSRNYFAVRFHAMCPKPITLIRPARKAGRFRVRHSRPALFQQAIPPRDRCQPDRVSGARGQCLVIFYQHSESSTRVCDGWRNCQDACFFHEHIFPDRTVHY